MNHYPHMPPQPRKPFGPTTFQDTLRELQEQSRLKRIQREVEAYAEQYRVRMALKAAMARHAAEEQQRRLDEHEERYLERMERHSQIYLGL